MTKKLAYSWSKPKRAYLPFGEEKDKSKGKGKFPVRPSCSPLENRRQRTEEVKAKTECDVFGRKGHWAYDRDSAMSPSSSFQKTQTHAARKTTRLHLSSQPKKVATCFVPNDCSDDSGILANIADQFVLLPKQSTGQTFPTPTVSTASTAVVTRTGSVSHVCVVDNDDELWLIEIDYKSGWNTRCKSGAHRGMPYRVVPRDNPKKAEPPIRIESVLDATIYILQRKTSTQTFVALRPSECDELSRKGSKEYFVETTV